MNEFDAQIVAYKNREQDLRRIIVVYDDDERVARVSARKAMRPRLRLTGCHPCSLRARCFGRRE